MNNIPTKLRKELAGDSYYRHCAREGLHGHECAGRVTWEHAMYFNGSQLQKRWAIVPLCAKAHSVDEWQDRGDMDKEINQWIALNRASQDDLLEVSKATDYFLYRGYLNRKYGAYVAPEADLAIAY